MALPSLKQVIDTYGLRAKKSLGQNFILNETLTDKIVRLACLDPEVPVVEIGPGPGGLTRALLRAQAPYIIAIEYDDRCLKALEDLVALDPQRLKLIKADALSLPLASIQGGPFHIIANLPYNIGTRLLLNWCEEKQWVKRMTLMFQKEVADRLAASPGTSAYGRLSVWIQWQMEVKQLLTLPPSVFSPPPKVTSAVVDIRPRPAVLYPADPTKLQTLLGAAFGQRRKMLRRSLKTLPSFTEAWFEQSRISGEARPEELSIEAFCRLSAFLS